MIPHIDQLVRTRRRTVGIYVLRDARLVVRAPKNANKAYINDLVAQHAQWIEQKQRQMQELNAQRIRHDYCEGDTILFFGNPLTLRFASHVRAPQQVDDCLLLPEAADAIRSQQLVEGWYKAAAREYFALRANDFARLLGVQYTAIRLSGARTRWGSCGPSNSINLVWRLVKAPCEVIDYVILHELAHILYRNHGPAFWAQVQALMPDYKARRKWLKAHYLELE